MRRPAEDHPFFSDSIPTHVAHGFGDVAGMEKQLTMAGLEVAIAAGVTSIEFDTVKTKNYKSLVFHGSEDLPIGLRNGRPTTEQIEDMTLDETRKITIDGEPIPRTEEVLSLIRSKGVNAYVDPKSKGSVNPLAEAINNQKAWDYVNVGSFRHRRTARVAELTGNKICSSLFKNRRVMPLWYGATLRRMIRYSGVNTLQIPHNLISKDMIEEFQDSGIYAVAWPKMGPKDNPRKYDTSEYIEQAIGMGFNGFMTDHTIEAIAAVLAYRSIRDLGSSAIKQ